MTRVKTQFVRKTVIAPPINHVVLVWRERSLVSDVDAVEIAYLTTIVTVDPRVRSSQQHLMTTTQLGACASSTVTAMAA